MLFPLPRPRFLVCVLLWFQVQSVAGVGQWKTYTTKREVRSVAITKTNNTVWAATSGGMFSYRLSDSTFNEFTASEGLKTIDLTAITVDAAGTVWSGASNGFVHAYNPRTGQWQYVSDINKFSAPQKQINALQAIGDTLFISSAVGVSVFSISRMEFGDTYKRFGSPPNQLVGNANSVQILNGKFWVSTSSGVASTAVSNPNPLAPESWTVYTAAQGLPSNTISGIVVLDDTLYAGTSSGIAYFDGASWQVIQGTQGLNVIDIALHSGCPLCDPPRIEFITPSLLGNVSSANGSVVFSQSFTATLTAIAQGNLTVLGTQSQGVLVQKNASFVSVLPLGPPTNGFYGMTVDDRGVLWSGTGVSSPAGFARFDGQVWRTYDPTTNSALINGAFRINTGPNGTKWVNLFGGGVAVLGAVDSINQVFNTTNGLPYTTNQFDSTHFVAVMGVATDFKGDVWINVRSAFNDSVLAVYTPSTGSFRYVRSPFATPIPILTNIVMDSYGTMWFSTQSDPGNPAPGLVLYNPASGWDVVTKSDGLTDNQISSVALDIDNNVWVGTVSGGINIIVDPTNPHNRILIYHPLNDQRIYDILVDPVNNKWVGTDNGVFVLSSDGTSILNQYTTESTDGKLPDNTITSLTMDSRTGTVYIGTAKGLATLTTAAIIPVQSFSELSISPNPFYLPSTKQLTVDGLVANSSLKILSIDGKLIRDLSTPGGRIGFWDGLDGRGQIVGTGIYLIVAYSQDGNQVATGKVAVVRR